MKKEKPDQLLKFAIDIGELTGKKLYAAFRKGRPTARGTSKEVKSMYDEISDKIIKNSIEKNFPNHSLLTEETGLIKKEEEYLWIIDPLDGTGNFLNHNPFFSVSIALFFKGKPLLGVIEAPMLKERFVAVSGQGAFYYDFITKKKEKAKVSNIKDLKKSYFVYCEGGERDKKRIANIFQNIYLRAKGIRKIGSAALELAWIGVGRAEGYFTTQISLWDIAAGMLFAKEAQGAILHFDGTPYKWEEFTPFGKFDILATNGKIKIKLENSKSEV